MTTSVSKPKKLLWSVGLITLVLAFSTVYLVHHYGETRPTVAEPAIGRTHPVKIHDRTVYLTTGEYALAFGSHAVTIVTIGVFIGMLLKARRRQVS